MLIRNFGGMGNENIVVIGIPRNKRNFIEVIVRRRSVENFRCKKVFSPAVLKRMENSKYSCWWGNSDEDRERIIQCAEIFNEDRNNAEMSNSSECPGDNSEDNRRTAECESMASEERESKFLYELKKN